MHLHTVESVLVDQVRDLYNAESQLLKALPRFAKAASSDSLRRAMEAHLLESRMHVERLTKVAEILEISPAGKTCKAMKGLIEEGIEATECEGCNEARDASLIAATQRIEHYEIAAYGTARAFAEKMGEEEIAALLEATLEEEKSADLSLTEISLGEVLPILPLHE